MGSTWKWRARVETRRKVVEVEGGKLFLPEERADELAGAIREHWAASEALIAA